ncbi:HIT domain-containing protein [Magnetospirillum moscoviense]|uniref:Diadenosine tetraphosphate hydrolase n=1 Tax=Magnetospirillum moscoviense TaxID=1437059 RepID=A0A178N1Q3_9PROT|nr:HIT family protein [Magnetospirillum moscoviense]OAN67012.1 diadenosine tetraphosphate hydrolase [Magnetospirillum moscoviense]
MFELHPRLTADTIPVTDWPLCRVMLMRDANYPWLVLVPRRHGVTEIHELDQSDRQTLIEEIAAASQRLQNLTQAYKINVAALGNVVQQLHVHVIARFTTDPAWPNPVWGAVPAKPYADSEMTRLLGAFAS